VRIVGGGVLKLNLALIPKKLYSDIHIKEMLMDIWILIGVVAVWFILNRWVLPKLGVPT